MKGSRPARKEEEERRDRRAREILGVSARAGAPEIKRAFWALAMRYHPDRNPHDPTANQTFSLVNRAYEYLMGKTGDLTIPSGKAAAESPPEKYGRNSWGYFCRWREAFMDEFMGGGRADE